MDKLFDEEYDQMNIICDQFENQDIDELKETEIKDFIDSETHVHEFSQHQDQSEEDVYQSGNPLTERFKFDTNQE